MKAFSTVVLVLVASVLSAQTEADRLASRAVLFSSAPSLAVTVQLTVYQDGRSTKTRTLEILSDRSGSDPSRLETRLLIRVLAPASLRNLKFLRVSSPDTTATWLKTSKGVQRLAPSADPEPLFASDFSTADFLPALEGWTEIPSGTNKTLERHGTGTMGWTTQRMVLRGADGLVLECSYFDVQGNLVRRYSVKELNPDTGFPVRIELRDYKRNSSSELLLLDHKAGSKSDPGLFSPGNL